MREVPGFGNPQAKILVLGEAPSTVELAKGIPFVGPAGEKLDGLLQMAGIKREDLYLTNASLEMVDKTVGKKDQFFFHKGGQPTDVFVRGLLALQQDIQRIKPNVVLALGNYALWAMMQHQAIMNWRGSILWSEVFGVKVVPTIHPAALLRGQDEFAGGTKGRGGMHKMITPVLHDLRRAKEQSLFPERNLRPRHVEINPEGPALDEAVAILESAENLDFDCETFGGNRLACIGFSDGNPERAWVFECDTKERVGICKGLLENPSSRKRGHNICAYDVPMLDSAGIHARNVYWDTLISQHILVPDLPKSLAFCQSVYTDMPYHKDEGKILYRLKIRTREDMIREMNYCGKDVMSGGEIAEKQPELIEERGLWPVWTRRMLMFEPLRGACALGFKADIQCLYDQTVRTKKLLDAAQAELDKEAGHPVNVNSNGVNGQVKTLLYKERGIAPRYKDGKLVADAHILADIAARSDDPVPMMIVKTRKYDKALSNYYNIKVLSPDGRIRSIQGIAGTASGRLNSSIPLWGPGVPIQTIPLEARRAYIADDGWEILECDGAQAEAVIVAYMANDPVHMDCFRTGKDVHRVTACLLSDVPVDRWAEIPKKSTIREIAKTCNHELNYNAGPRMFMLTVNEEYDPDDPMSVRLDYKEALVLWNRYHQIRPALKGYWETIKYELRHNRMTLKSPLGWEYTFLGQWSDSLLNLAYSWKPQSTVGESTNVGILQTLGLLPPPAHIPERLGLEYQSMVKKSGTKLLAQVHDSATWLTPRSSRSEVAPAIMALMEVPLYINGYNICVPIEAAVGQNWCKLDMEPLGVTRTTVEL